ncbi:MAG: hypothetical protein QOE41_4939 [Mycobacterium sp.]|jgi:hypothetical protein|nr:hypothetical protein [Mycobacterium sp.]MDT5135628.1 hypothetical protein [Mycobacterium sp.]
MRSFQSDFETVLLGSTVTGIAREGVQYGDERGLGRGPAECQCRLDPAGTTIAPWDEDVSLAE